MIDGSEIYWYKSGIDLNPQIMHSLIRTFSKEQPEEVVHDLGNMTLWPVKIILPPNKSRIVYFETEEEQHKCFQMMNISNEFVDFF